MALTNEAQSVAGCDAFRPRGREFASVTTVLPPTVRPDVAAPSKPVTASTAPNLRQPTLKGSVESRTPFGLGEPRRKDYDSVAA